MLKRKTVTDVSEEHCDFCGRGVDDGLTDLLSSSATGMSICRECSETTFLIGARMHQLREKAKEHAIEAIKNGTPNNDDGSCNCPNCTYPRLMESDTVIRDLLNSSHFVNEQENAPTTSTVQ